MTVILTPYTGGTAYTAAPNAITVTKKSTNKITAVKSSNPVIIRLGRTTSIILNFRVYGDTDCGIVMGWGGETVLVATSSTHAEMPNGNYLIKNLESKQKSGNIQIRDVKLDLEYYYTGAVI